LRLSKFFLFVACAGSVIAGAGGAALADYRIRNDYGGFIHKYKLKYAAIRDSGKRVIIDGVCNSACTLVLGIVPLNRVCVTPRASLGFHTAYFAKNVYGWHQGDELLGHRGYAGVLPGDG